MVKVVPCEVYSRVVGYYRPVQNWNNGKRSEFADRQTFSEEVCMKRDFGCTETAMEEKSLAAEEPAPIPEQVSEVTVNVNGSTNSSVAGFKIYTLPGCSKCVEVKDFLHARNMEGKEVNLRNSEGMDDFKAFYRDNREKIKRGEDRTAQLPIVVLTNGDGVVGIAQSLDEVKAYL